MAMNRRMIDDQQTDTLTESCRPFGAFFVFVVSGGLRLQLHHFAPLGLRMVRRATPYRLSLQLHHFAPLGSMEATSRAMDQKFIASRNLLMRASMSARVA